MAIALSIFITGVFVVAAFGVTNHKKEPVLFGFSLVVVGVVLMSNDSWGAWCLFFQNLLAVVPVWVRYGVGVWIYLNIGWRFAEYKLRVAARWRTTAPVLLHILWPVDTQNNDLAAHPHQTWFKNDKPDDKRLYWYKFWTATLLAGQLIISALMISLCWLFWIATMGRFKPIHPEIW